MEIFDIIKNISLYVIVLVSIFLLMYTLTQAYLAFIYRQSQSGKKRDQQVSPSSSEGELPSVLVQLPVYNEPLVVRRVINAVSKLNYPPQLLTIQVLDDSNDSTSQVVRSVLQELANEGLEIQHIRRTNRIGYKAGALQNGMQRDSSEFIAIFDADFVPEPDFLKKTISYFGAADVGLVQTRWLHMNADESLLTRLLAFAIDGHFSVEQGGRQAGGYFTNFNGTAGIIRRRALEDAGGWQDDCLTEDLDMSFRLQLKGWRIRFVEEISTRSELPGNMSAIKSQQFRWTKGACETARKNISTLWNSEYPFMTKFIGSMHMLNSSVFLLVFVMSLCTVPAVLLSDAADAPTISAIITMQTIGNLCMVFVYWASNIHGSSEHRTTNFWTILTRSVLLSLMQIGISMGNAVGVIQGALGYRTEFVRTPKFYGSSGIRNEQYALLFIRKNASWRLLAEFLFFSLLLATTITGIAFKNYLILPYSIFITLSFGLVFYWSMKELLNAYSASTKS